MKLNFGIVSSAIISIVVLVVLFTAYGSITPEITESGDAMNASNMCNTQGCWWNESKSATVPCRNNISVESVGCRISTEIPGAGFFGGKGIAILVIFAALLIFVARNLIKK